MKQRITAALTLFLALTMWLPAQENQSIYYFQPTLQTAPAAVQPAADEITAQKKSVPLAVLYSVLLPGMGELYGGSYVSGKYLTMLEAGCWVTYFGMQYYSGYQKDNYKAYAIEKGGVAGTAHSSDYYADLGMYSDITTFNDEKSFQREFDRMYDPAKDYWKWSSTTDRRTYRSMWLSSQHAHNNLRFVVSAMLLNRLVSAINAARITASYNKKLAAGTSLLLNVQPDLIAGGVSANLQVQF